MEGDPGTDIQAGHRKRREKKKLQTPGLKLTPLFLGKRRSDGTSEASRGKEES